MFKDRLQRARKAAGLSLRALATQAGVSHAAIKKYEDGAVMPSSDVLIRIARALKVRTEYFFRPDTVALDGVEYRKKAALPKKRLDAITHDVQDRIERRLELESLFPVPPVQPFRLPDGLPERVHSLAEVERVADAVRRAWGLGEDPIPDLVDVLETRGVRVFAVSVDALGKFDGMAACANGMPVVVLAAHAAGDRQRFTLAHELGHLLLDGRLAPALDEEAACNRFAGAFLMPESSARREFGERRTAIEPRELSLLKEEYGMSMSGLLYRALDLGIITPAYRTQQHRYFNARGWRVREPGAEYPTEKAHVFEQLVFHALAENYIGESKAAELLGLSLTQFHRLRALENTDAPADQ